MLIFGLVILARGFYEQVVASPATCWAWGASDALVSDDRHLWTADRGLERGVSTD